MTVLRGHVAVLARCRVSRWPCGAGQLAVRDPCGAGPRGGAWVAPLECPLAGAIGNPAVSRFRSSTDVLAIPMRRAPPAGLHANHLIIDLRFPAGSWSSRAVSKPRPCSLRPGSPPNSIVTADNLAAALSTAEHCPTINRGGGAEVAVLAALPPEHPAEQIRSRLSKGLKRPVAAAGRQDRIVRRMAATTPDGRPASGGGRRPRSGPRHQQSLRHDASGLNLAGQ